MVLPAKTCPIALWVCLLASSVVVQQALGQASLKSFPLTLSGNDPVVSNQNFSLQAYVENDAQHSYGDGSLRFRYSLNLFYYSSEDFQWAPDLVGLLFVGTGIHLSGISNIDTKVTLTVGNTSSSLLWAKGNVSDDGLSDLPLGSYVAYILPASLPQDSLSNVNSRQPSALLSSIVIDTYLMTDKPSFDDIQNFTIPVYDYSGKGGFNNQFFKCNFAEFNRTENGYLIPGGSMRTGSTIDFFVPENASFLTLQGAVGPTGGDYSIRLVILGDGPRVPSSAYPLESSQLGSFYLTTKRNALAGGLLYYAPLDPEKRYQIAIDPGPDDPNKDIVIESATFWFVNDDARAQAVKRADEAGIGYSRPASFGVATTASSSSTATSTFQWPAYQSNSTPVMTIVGATIGCVLGVILLIVVIVVLVLRRRKTKRAAARAAEFGQNFVIDDDGPAADPYLHYLGDGFEGMRTTSAEQSLLLPDRRAEDWKQAYAMVGRRDTPDSSSSRTPDGPPAGGGTFRHLVRGLRVERDMGIVLDQDGMELMPPLYDPHWGEMSSAPDSSSASTQPVTTRTEAPGVEIAPEGILPNDLLADLKARSLPEITPDSRPPLPPGAMQGAYPSFSTQVSPMGVGDHRDQPSLDRRNL